MVTRVRLTAAEARRRARRIRLVLSDVDGVLTDTGVYYSARGEVLYRFSRRDGMGFDLLREAGIRAGIITSENSPIIRRRAEKLGLPEVHLGIRNKAEHLRTILRKAGLLPGQLAYIGDDVNDLGAIRLIGKGGLTAAPHDAIARILRAVHYRCGAEGGRGAFREFAEWILALRGGG